MVSKHLTLEEREKIEILISKGYSVHKIARLTNRSHTSLLKEIKRNGGREKYNAIEANKRVIEVKKANWEKLINMSKALSNNTVTLHNKISALEIQISFLFEEIEQLRNNMKGE